jgi:hypothetical protein
MSASVFTAEAGGVEMFAGVVVLIAEDIVSAV